MCNSGDGAEQCIPVVQDSATKNYEAAASSYFVFTFPLGLGAGIQTY